MPDITLTDEVLRRAESAEFRGNIMYVTIALHRIAEASRVYTNSATAARIKQSSDRRKMRKRLGIGKDGY